MDSAERLAGVFGWRICEQIGSVTQFLSRNGGAYMSDDEIAKLLDWHDRAEVASDLAEALKGCNGALIGASEALLARGYVATVDTLGKYIRGAEQALRKWEGAANE